MIWYQIRRAFAFSGIKHPDLAPFLTRVPFIVALLLALGFELLPVRPKFTGDGSVSRHMLTIFAILPGFYIAALAAVATFNREEMDYEMPEPAPKMVLRTRGDDQEMVLTFRMFLTHMFSYLTALSFLAVFMFVGAELIAPSAKLLIGKLSSDWRNVATYALGGSYLLLSFWLAAKIILTTMIGLYFLAERIHRPEV